MGYKLSLAAALATLALTQPLESQPVPSAPALTYADLADLAVAAPIAAHLRIRGADALRPEEAPNLAPGVRRYLVTADVVALIRGSGGLPGQVTYLVDLPNDSHGHAVRPRRRDEVLVLAAPVAGRPAELRLVAPDAQLPFSAPLAERLRAVVRDSMAADAPPRLTGIGRAFHVPGSLPGESETQIFLQTAGGRPVSLTILRRPGQQPRWAVALSEIVDEAAAPPAPDTLLWYRLACTLPAVLPPQSLSEASAEEAQAIRADYAVVIDGLGRCTRSRARR